MIAKDSPLLAAARREATEYTPVWFMRQAGRSLPEYRRIREKYDFFTVCQQPDLCAEVTLQPVKRLGVDAAILFADITTPLVGIGIEVDLVESVGPVIAAPVRTVEDLARLRDLEPEQDLGYVLETLRILRRELPETVALIGFAGAPFTLATYLVEGKPSRDYTQVKTFMYRAPEVWRALMERLSAITIAYLQAQIQAGAQIVQLFDSWVGWLGPADYETYVLPYSRRIFEALRGQGVPLIHFGTTTAGILDLMASAGADVMSVDWRIPLDAAWKRVGMEIAIQGNLDPVSLLAPREVLWSRADDVLRRANGRPGHIFNLGHGLLPQTNPDEIAALVTYVHEQSQQYRSQGAA
ncbi:MAG TPA: uroporphyrinogen decarboxylase [Dehalococcoidia bacterium]|nr:uroporphyrinogen decarboxylase [Dehalococcoidia bacterium]